MEGSFGAGELNDSRFSRVIRVKDKEAFAFADVNKGGTAIIRPLQETARGIFYFIGKCVL